MNIEKKIEEIREQLRWADDTMFIGCGGRKHSRWYLKTMRMVKELSQLLQESNEEAVRGFAKLYRNQWITDNNKLDKAIEQYLKENE